MNAVSISNSDTVSYLTDNYLTKSNPQMAKELGTTVGSVTGMLQRLELKRPSRQIIVDAIAGEVWLPCRNHPGFKVSNLGRVANGDILLVQTLNGRGYLQVKMYTASGERKSERVHRLVADAFLPPREKKNEVNHIDGNKANNAAVNLEWVNGSENVRHAVKLGLVTRRTGTAHHQCTHDEKIIRQVCNMIRAGVSSGEIERQLTLRQGYVSKIRSKRIWRTISDEYFA